MNELPNKQMLLTGEVASYFRVTERTIRNWIASGDLVSVKKGGTRRVTRESVLDFDRSNKKSGDAIALS